MKVENEPLKTSNRGFEEKKKDAVEIADWSKESIQAFGNMKEETVDVHVDQVKCRIDVSFNIYC